MFTFRAWTGCATAAALQSSASIAPRIASICSLCDICGRFADAILTETDKYWVNISDDLYFFADGKRFLWSSERTGFRHYYLYDLAGKELAQLTSGDWAITGTSGFGPGAASHPAVDEAHGYIYFLSNKDNVRETQLYRVSLADKTIKRITKDPGTHEVILAPDDSAFVDKYSNAMTPPRQDLVSRRRNPRRGDQ